MQRYKGAFDKKRISYSFCVCVCVSWYVSLCFISLNGLFVCLCIIAHLRFRWIFFRHASTRRVSRKNVFIDRDVRMRIIDSSKKAMANDIHGHRRGIKRWKENKKAFDWKNTHVRGILFIWSMFRLGFVKFSRNRGIRLLFCSFIRSFVFLVVVEWIYSCIDYLQYTLPYCVPIAMNANMVWRVSECLRVLFNTFHVNELSSIHLFDITQWYFVVRNANFIQSQRNSSSTADALQFCCCFVLFFHSSIGLDSYWLLLL